MTKQGIEIGYWINDDPSRGKIGRFMTPSVKKYIDVDQVARKSWKKSFDKFKVDKQFKNDFDENWSKYYDLKVGQEGIKTESTIWLRP